MLEKMAATGLPCILSTGMNPLGGSGRGRRCHPGAHGVFGMRAAVHDRLSLSRPKKLVLNVMASTA